MTRVGFGFFKDKYSIDFKIQSVERWDSGDLWINWIKETENRFSTRFVEFEKGVHFDPSHRVPRVTKVENLYDEFENLGSTTMFYSGRFFDGKLEVFLDILYYVQPKWQRNYMRLLFKGNRPDDEKLKVSFRKAVELFRANEGSVDYFGVIKRKDRKRGQQFGIGLESVGMLWLNYFGPAICGRYAGGIDALRESCRVEEMNFGGIEIILKNHLDDLSIAERLRAEETVGKELFWDPKRKQRKEYGQHFPTYEEFQTDWSSQA